METIAHIRQKLDQHDDRLRAVENALVVLPRMEHKLDQLLEVDHRPTIEVMQTQAKFRDREITDLKEDIKELKEQSTQTTEKFWKVAIVIALILGALQGMGIDVTSILPKDPASIIGGP